MRKLAIATVATGILAGGAAFLFTGDDGASAAPAAPAGPPPATVGVVEIASERLPAVAMAPGTVLSRNDARISAEVVGRLAWVAEVGTEVPNGGVVARIDATESRLQLAQSEANLGRMQATLQLQEQQLERMRALAAQKLVSVDQLDEAESRHEIARQDLAQAAVARDQANYRVERSEVRAPFGGRVVERLRQPGEFTAVGSEVVRLVDLRNVEVRAQAPLSVANFVKVGDRVQVGEEGAMVEGRVRTVIPIGDERSRLLEVRVTAPGNWAVGTAVRVALPQSAPREVLAVHRDALILRQGGTFVFKVGEGDVAQRVAIKLGVEHGEMVEVQGELIAGDRVIVRGAERLQPGQPVKVETG